ncbi:MAG: hypothetical protein ABID09_07685 [Candidatus Omnitrophota bacterium]
MGSNSPVRVWQEMDITAIKPHLLIAGTLSCDCGNCKEVGLNVESRSCTSCGTTFRYVGTRTPNSAKDARRIRSRRADLVIIDLSDFKVADARTKAHGLLGD